MLHPTLPPSPYGHALPLYPAQGQFDQMLGIGPEDPAMWGYLPPADGMHHGWEALQLGQYYDAPPDLAAHNTALHPYEEGGGDLSFGADTYAVDAALPP